MIHGYSRIDTALYDMDALLRNRYNRTVNALVERNPYNMRSVVACSSIPCTPEYIFPNNCTTRFSKNSVRPKTSTMIHCFNQPNITELTLSSLRVAGFQNVESMPSGFMHSLNEDDYGPIEQLTVPSAASFEEVKSVEHPSDNRPKPKRPLSAYNWFFHSERKNILNDTPIRKEGKPRRSHGKIGFADLARLIAAKWKSLSKEDRATYDEKATIDKDRYLKEMEEWKKWQTLAVSQLPSPSHSVHRDMMAFPNDTFNVSALVRQQPVYSRDALEGTQSVENASRNEMKTSGREYFTTESYSLSDIFGAEFTRRLQQSPSHNPSPPPQIAAAAESTTRRSSNIQSLASQLGDESTELFLDLFRDPDCT